MTQDVRIERETPAQPKRTALFTAGDDAFLARYKAIQARIAEALGEPPVVIYTGYPVVRDLPVDNLDAVAVSGHCRFEPPDGLFWANDSEYQSPTVFDPTWLQLACLADAMIRVIRDQRHWTLDVFLEGVRWCRQEGDVMIYRFSMGS